MSILSRRAVAVLVHRAITQGAALESAVITTISDTYGPDSSRIKAAIRDEVASGRLVRVVAPDGAVRLHLPHVEMAA